MLYWAVWRLPASASPKHWHRGGSRKFEHTGVGRKQNRASSPKRWLYCRTSSENFMTMKTWVQNGSGQTNAKPIKPEDYLIQILVHTEITPRQKLPNFTGYWQSTPKYYQIYPPLPSSLAFWDCLVFQMDLKAHQWEPSSQWHALPLCTTPAASQECTGKASQPDGNRTSH